ncbi:MAG: Hpt domain-containing protein [Eubacteriales bacterium]|nr:Hpt domain-containing protein [Eubacteriales bacterium]
MSKMIDTMRQLNCDIDAAMDRFLNDEEFYKECLCQVLMEESYGKLGEALKAGKVEEAFEYAHSLKGVLANLGLTPLLKLVTELVEPLRQGQSEGLMPVYERLIEERDNMLRISREL